MHICYIFRHLTISETLVDWPWTCWSKLPCIRSHEIIPHQWRAILGKRRSYFWFTAQVKLHPLGRSFHEFSNYLRGNARCVLCTKFNHESELIIRRWFERSWAERWMWVISTTYMVRGRMCECSRVCLFMVNAGSCFLHDVLELQRPR
jgi:hypothetical protein